MRAPSKALKKAAVTFFKTLPSDLEGPERALAFRRLIARAAYSRRDRALVCAVYRMLATGEIRASSVHDVQMFLSAVTECLDVVPRVRADVEQFLAEHFRAQDAARGLWEYILELHRHNVTARRKRDSERLPSVVSHGSNRGQLIKFIAAAATIIGGLVALFYRLGVAHEGFRALAAVAGVLTDNQMLLFLALLVLFACVTVALTLAAQRAADSRAGGRLYQFGRGTK